MPLRVDHRLFNCAVVVFGGRVLGVVPKTYLPNYGEFYEARQFNSGDTALAREVRLLGADVPFGADLLFKATNLPLLTIHLRDLRRRLGADSALELRGAGRRDGARQPVGIEHHDRQVGLPAPARQRAIGALPGGLPVFVGRPRRIDDRPRLGRPGADLRERRAAGAVGALRRRLALHQRRRRPRARLARAHAPELVRRFGREAQGAAAGVPQRRLRAADPRGAVVAVAAPGRALPVRARRHRPRATSAAARSTTSRCRRWCSGCRRPASPRS